MSGLDDDPFSYRVTKAGTVLVSRGGRQIMILGGKRAEQLIAAMERADENGQQQALARVTGNYRRGNERLGKEHRGL